MSKPTNDIAEIGPILAAKEHGDIEPLLLQLESHGLYSQEARDIVAGVARGNKLRKSGQHVKSADTIARDRDICLMVAFHRGQLRKQGKSPSGAIARVMLALETKGDALDRRQVARIWDAGKDAGTVRMFESEAEKWT